VSGIEPTFLECPACGRRVRAHPVTKKFVAHSSSKNNRKKDCVGVLNTARGAVIAAADRDHPLGRDRDPRTVSGGAPTLGKGRR
jgi:hypothetical protein